MSAFEWDFLHEVDFPKQVVSLTEEEKTQLEAERSILSNEYIHKQSLKWGAINSAGAAAVSSLAVPLLFVASAPLGLIGAVGAGCMVWRFGKSGYDEARRILFEVKAAVVEALESGSRPLEMPGVFPRLSNDERKRRFIVNMPGFA